MSGLSCYDYNEYFKVDLQQFLVFYNIFNVVGLRVVFEIQKVVLIVCAAGGARQ